MSFNRFVPRMTVLDWITVLAIATAAVFIVGGLFGVVPFAFSYLLFVILTVSAVRSVPVEPGTWLGLRRIRRGLVCLIGALTLWFLVAPEVSLVAFVALALCDFALGRATRRIASAPREVLDERQDAWRNRAYQIAYALFAVLVGGVLMVANLTTPGARQWLATQMQTGGVIVGFFQLLLFLPSMVIAWREPDIVADRDAPRLRQSVMARVAAVMLILCLVVPPVLSLSLAVAPIKVTAYTAPQADPAGASCKYFGARKEVGIGVRATVPISAVACWDGKRAYQSWGLSASDCVMYNTDFAALTNLECSRTTDASGTMHFVFRSLARSPFLPFVTREITMRLDLTKDGKVVQFP